MGTTHHSSSGLFHTRLPSSGADTAQAKQPHKTKGKKTPGAGEAAQWLKAFAAQAWRPEFKSHTEAGGVVRVTVIPASWEGETGESPEPEGQLACRTDSGNEMLPQTRWKVKRPLRLPSDPHTCAA